MWLLEVFLYNLYKYKNLGSFDITCCSLAHSVPQVSTETGTAAASPFFLFWRNCTRNLFLVFIKTPCHQNRHFLSQSVIIRSPVKIFHCLMAGSNVTKFFSQSSFNGSPWYVWVCVWCFLPPNKNNVVFYT